MIAIGVRRGGVLLRARYTRESARGCVCGCVCRCVCGRRAVRVMCRLEVGLLACRLSRAMRTGHRLHAHARMHGARQDSGRLSERGREPDAPEGNQDTEPDRASHA